MRRSVGDFPSSWMTVSCRCCCEQNAMLIFVAVPVAVRELAWQIQKRQHQDDAQAKIPRGIAVITVRF